MSGGGGSSTIQKSDPWAGVQPYLQRLYGDANAWANDNNGRGPAIAQNNGVAPLGQFQYSAINDVNTRANGSPEEALFKDQASSMARGNDWISQLLASQAQGGGQNNALLYGVANGTDTSGQALTSLAQGTDASSNYLKGVLSGQYLNPSSNPYLSGAVDAANADATRNFQTAVMPQLASQFSLAGRYGSGAQSQGISDATNNLAKTLSNNANTIYQQNYQNERGLQNGAASTLSGIQLGAGTALGNLKQNALSTISNNMNTNAGLLGSRSVAGTQLLPQASQLDWNNLAQRMNVAGMLQNQAQNELTGSNNLYNANQAAPYQNLQWLAGILQGTAGIGGQSSTQQMGSPLKSAIGGAASGALGGAAIGSQIGAIGGPMGAGIGAGLGLLMGVL